MTQYDEYLRLEAEGDAKIRELIAQCRLPLRGRVMSDYDIPSEVASWLIDKDVANGEYEGCSSELEIAYSDHCARVERILTTINDECRRRKP